MKKYIFILLTIAFASLNADAQHPQPLMDNMRTFFVETLKNNNYTGDTDEAIIKSFLSDYKDNFVNEDFSLKIDAKKFEKVNKQLAERKYTHFYYFYIDCIILSEEKYKKAEKKGFPVVKLEATTMADGRVLSAEESEKLKNISINKPFINEVAKSNTELSEFLNYCDDLVEDIPFVRTLDVFLKSNNEAEFANVVAVVYWKYLCEQVGVPFYIN